MAVEKSESDRITFVNAGLSIRASDEETPRHSFPETSFLFLYVSLLKFAEITLLSLD